MGKVIKRFVSLLKKLWGGSVNLSFILTIINGNAYFTGNGQPTSPEHSVPNENQEKQPQSYKTSTSLIIIQRFFVIAILAFFLAVVFIFILGIVRVSFAIIPAESPFQHLQETGMFFEDQESRYISWSEVQSLYKIDGISPRWALQTEINSYYAAQGLVFSKQSGYRDYFCQWDWYHPDESISEQMAWDAMSEYSKANVKLLSVARRLLS